MEPASQDGCDGGGEPADQRHLRHEPVRRGPVKPVSDDGPADYHPRSPCQALHKAKAQQPAEGRCQWTGQRHECVNHQRHQNDPPAAKRIRQSPVKQVHQGQGGQIKAQGGLDLKLADPKVAGYRGKGGEVGIHRKRPQRRQCAHDQGKASGKRARCSGRLGRCQNCISVDRFQNGHESPGTPRLQEPTDAQPAMVCQTAQRTVILGQDDNRRGHLVKSSCSRFLSPT